MEPTEHNRRAWDEIHRRRSEAVAGEPGIPDPIRERLPEVSGKHVLHLLCATGESTAELVELGALVTAVDISTEALDLARERAPNASLVHADVHELPLELRRGRFDLVYTGGGVLNRLHDLDAWAAGIVSALRPAGELLLYDDHPVSACLDATLRWREDYFDDGPIVPVGRQQPEVREEAGTEELQERFWRLGQIVTAVAGAGLRVLSLEEFPTIYKTHWRRQDRRVPGQFALRADKPAG
jgi:SAM-dependent methyltransferase